MECLRIPVTRFCYKQVIGYGAFQYKLHMIKHSENAHSFNYPSENILRTAPTPGAGIAKFNLFNKLYVPQCNAFSLQFEFISVDEIPEGVFSPDGALGKLMEVCECADLKFKEPACEWATIATSDLAFSVMAMMHHLVETNSGFFHVGISLMPSNSIFMPVWLSDATMAEWLDDWKNRKMMHALDKSIVSIQHLSGKTRVQSLHQDAALKASLSKWLL